MLRDNRCSAAMLLLISTSTSALRIHVPVHAKQAVASAALCSTLLASGPAFAGPLDDAILEVADSSYPIIKTLNPTTFSPFVDKIGDVVLKVKPDKLGKAVDAGIDYFLSIPDDKVQATNAAVKEAVSSCSGDKVPLPSSALFAKLTSSPAFSNVDAAKLKAFAAEAKPAVDALAVKDDLVCLPSVEALKKVSLAQAEAAKAADPAKVRVTARFKRGTFRMRMSRVPAHVSRLPSHTHAHRLETPLPVAGQGFWRGARRDEDSAGQAPPSRRRGAEADDGCGLQGARALQEGRHQD